MDWICVCESWLDEDVFCGDGDLVLVVVGEVFEMGCIGWRWGF